MLTDLHSVLRAAPVLCELHEADLAALVARASLRQLGARELLWRAGDAARHLAVVAVGRLKLVRPAGDQQLIVDVIGAGQLVGEVALTLQSAYAFDAVCLRRACVVLLPAHQVAAGIERSAHASRALAAELARDVLRLTRRLESLTARSVGQRLARVMVALMDRFGQPVEGSGILIPVRLRREELASLAGTTLESASRRLSRWRRAHIVLPQPAGFLVCDEGALRRLVDGDDEQPFHENSATVSSTSSA